MTLGFVLGAGLLSLGLMAGGAQAASVTCSPDLAVISSADGSRVAARFNVDIADDEAERAQGLMNRSSMPAGSGMLFIYPTPRTVQFWMHDTLIPLDMLFFDESGRLVSLHTAAKPMDDTPIPSGGAIRFVLEINGNLASRLGIGPGAVLSYPQIPANEAAIPCGH